MSFPKTSRLPDIRGTFAKRWTDAGTGLLFVLATLACVVAFVATFYFFVRTTTGQYIDESALVEAATINGPAERATTQFLDWLPVISVAIAAVVVLFVTIMRRRWKSAGIALAACVAANLATQLLKDWFPNRPFRGVQTIELNSLPSGHTTLAASAAAAVFLVVSPRWRPVAGFLGGTFAVAAGVSTLINQWHRPADVVAAFLVVGAVMLPAGWLVLRTGKRWNVQDGRGGHWASSRLWLLLAAVAGISAAAVSVYSLLKIAPGVGRESSTTNYFWAGVSLIVITGYLATVAATWLFDVSARRRQSP
ncbi:phosphatase PAP2 family protein [Arthrobacter sp. SRS-W-1-2016]|uniref:phosphatase PAP2 family protein n=1 Tax=Arthrobacter sp. SRS-W-1-2016 TaxID=1930254 RepID=UPI0009913379|nr:phosphatase PAP2 family protein [Arthrobacter sp. SRS-W-1-2016]